MNYHPKHKSNSRTAVWIGAGVLAAVAIGAIIFIIVTLRSPMTKEEARAKAGIVYDSSATEGGWDNLSPEEIEARLNEKVAEGMINISANTAPIFEDGSSEGNLMLVNESINNYPQKVQIVRNDTGEQIYESGAIAVGSKIERAKLNEKVAEGMINISMNTAPYFEDGKAEGNVMIVNESINNYPQQVEFIRNDTGEQIYQSKAIPVGSKIERAALDVELPAGTYECTAMFHNLDPVSGEIIGTAGAIITITVKN